MEDVLFAALCDELAATVAAVGARGWLVGGCVRDVLLGRIPSDLDVVVDRDLRLVVDAFAVARQAAVAPLRATTVRVLSATGGWTVDISQMQGESVRSDLGRRDFTVNAMAVPLPHWRRLRAARGAASSGGASRLAYSWLDDPSGGLADLCHATLRAVSEGSFGESPTRLIRGARFVAAFAFVPDDGTTQLAREAAPLLATKSADLLREELGKLLAVSRCAVGARWLVEIGALDVLFERPVGGDDAAVALLGALAGLHPDGADGEQTPFSGVVALNDVGEAVREWYRMWPARYLGLMWSAFIVGASSSGQHAREERKHGRPRVRPAWMPQGDLGGVVWTAVRQCDEALELLARGETGHQAWRWYFEHGGLAEASLDALCIAWSVLALAEPSLVSFRSPALRQVVETFLTAPQQLMPPPLLNGRALIEALKVDGGPVVGQLLARVRRAQLDGEVTTWDEALAYAVHAFRTMET